MTPDADSVPDLSRLLEPECIAVVGASADSAKAGGRLVRNAVINPGLRIYAVNPTPGVSIPDAQLVSSLDQIAEQPDVAVIALRPPDAVAAAGQAAQRGIPFVVVVSGGFAETGPAGRQIQDELVAAVSGTGTRLIGPNCSGIWNVQDNVFLTISQGIDLAPHPPGPIGVVSQSGGLGRSFIDSGLPVGIWFGSGNNCDLTEADYVRYLADRDDISVIALIIEGISDVAGLRTSLEHARNKSKPVVAVKLGRSQLGQSVATSHTGALATDDRLVDALFRHCGVVRCDEIAEAADAAAIAAQIAGGARGRATTEPNIAICTFSGGTGTLIADAIGLAGGSLAEFGAATKNALAEALPPIASIGNPVDLTTEVYKDVSLVPAALQQLRQDPAVDVVVFGFTSRTGQPDGLIARAIIDAVAQTPGAPVVATDISADPARPDWAGQLAAGGVPVVRGGRRTVAAIRACWDAWLSGRAAGERELPQKTEQPSLVSGVRGEHQAKQYLAGLGIHSPLNGYASDESEVLGLARMVGFPLVLKIDLPGIKHKSELGFVVTDIMHEPDLDVALQQLRLAATRHGIGRHGILVERQQPRGIDFILGLDWDEEFGHKLIFGLGGDLAEAIDDVVVCLVPAQDDEVRSLPQQLKAWPRLWASRQGLLSAGLPEVESALLSVGGLAASDSARRWHLEINPLRLCYQTGNLVALDAKLEVA
jgi:acetate---CoA ligase (ADP-forming)